MFNHIVDILGFSIYSYGLLTAIGYLVGIWLITREAARSEVDPKIIIEMAFPILVWTVIGARLLYIITNIPFYIDQCNIENDCFGILRVWEGGLVFYGGLIGGASAAIYYIKKHKLNTFKVLDILAIGMPIGHAIGRIGCFSAGCCYGHHTDSFLGVEFPSNSIPFNDHVIKGVTEASAHHSLTIHPTQLYEALGVTLIFLILWSFRNRKRFHGQIGLMYMVLYSIERSIVEIFRGDGIRKHLFKFSPDSLTGFLGLPKGSPILLSTSQFISLIIIVISSGFLIYLSKKAKKLV